jgi:hypothetical protein
MVYGAVVDKSLRSPPPARELLFILIDAQSIGIGFIAHDCSKNIATEKYRYCAKKC